MNRRLIEFLSIALLIGVFLLNLQGCVSVPPTTPQPNIVGLLPWGNPAWDEALLAEIRAQGLADVASLKDSGEYCPAYAKLSKAEREHFWATLFVAMAKKESNWKPTTTYKESFNDAQGKPVISAGLFQISPESASSSRYGCGKLTATTILIPSNNISCSVKIAARWVKEDGYAGKTVSGAQKGCARYWSVCRNSSSSRAFLIEQTRKLGFCG